MSSLLPDDEGSRLASKRRLKLGVRRSERRDFKSRLRTVWAEHTAVTQEGATSYPIHESCVQATPGERVALRCASVTGCQLTGKSCKCRRWSGGAVTRWRACSEKNHYKMCRGRGFFRASHTYAHTQVRNRWIHWGDKTITASQSWSCFVSCVNKSKPLSFLKGSCLEWKSFRGFFMPILIKETVFAGLLWPPKILHVSQRFCAHKCKLNDLTVGIKTVKKNLTFWLDCIYTPFGWTILCRTGKEEKKTTFAPIVIHKGNSKMCQ